MEKAVWIIKREPVLTVSFVLAAVSAIFVPPDKEYLSYGSLSVLCLLLCLMVIVAGLRQAGLFDEMARRLTQRVRTEKGLLWVLCGECFFLSALITNDVALITFVPFILLLLRGQPEKTVIFAVTMETVCANLGSLLTPIGNPQNLYLYTYYHMAPGTFFAATLPLGGLCALLIALTLLLRPNRTLPPFEAPQAAPLRREELAVYGALFALCLLTVMKVLPCWVVFAVVTLTVWRRDKRLFAAADYVLLGTFVCFFIFVGNAARIPWIHQTVSQWMTGREVLAGALLSQCISNVPAAAMLSAFTEKGTALVIGTNIGGLGTLIASMASLISYRQIREDGAVRPGRYLLTFSAVNLLFLAVLLMVYGK